MPRWLATMSIAAACACYTPPEPACGFICGPQGECPADYTCAAADRRCHRDGTTETCPSGIDAAAGDAPGSARDAGVADGPPQDGPGFPPRSRLTRK